MCFSGESATRPPPCCEHNIDANVSLDLHDRPEESKKMFTKLARKLTKQKPCNRKEKEDMSEFKNTQKLDLSSPWMTFVRELETLFEHDEDVSIQYDNELCTVKLFVESTTKAEALTQLLPAEKQFGNVSLKILVVPANLSENKTALVQRALENNPVLEEIVELQRGPQAFKYLMFSNGVAQFYNDQLDDPYGNKYMLYANIARDVFGDIDGAFYCTEPMDSEG